MPQYPQYPRNRKEFMDFTRKPFPNVPEVKADIVTKITDPASPFKVQFENITPERAAYLLSQRSDITFGSGLETTGNRNLNFTRVEQYVREMRGGEGGTYWRTTHQGIALDEHGNLIDGQHRLWAIILSGLPQVMLVAIGVPAATFYLLDQGLARSASAFVRGAHSGARTTLARNLMYWSHLALEDDGTAVLTKTNVRPKVAIATHEILQFLADNPAINAYGLEYAAKASKYQHLFPELGAAPLLLAGFLAGDHQAFWEDVQAVFDNSGVPTGSVVHYMTLLREVKVADESKEPDVHGKYPMVAIKEYTLVQIMRAILCGLAYREGEEVPRTGGFRAAVPVASMPIFRPVFDPEALGINPRRLNLSRVNLADMQAEEEDAA